MSEFFISAMNGGMGAVTSVTGANGVTASPTTGAVVVYGVNATTTTVGVASFNPLNFTVSGGEVSLISSVALSYVTDSGTATPSGGVLNVLTPGGGTEGVATSGAGNTITVTLTETANTYVNVVGPTTYDALVTDFFISVNCTAGPVTIVLPAAPPANKEFVVKDRLGQAATNNITVQSAGGNTIDTEISYVFSDNFESVDCLFHGTNYEVF
jgi:hypothetical protein